MSTENENPGSWLDEIKELIRRKQAESSALKKIQETLQSGGMTAEDGGNSTAKEDHIPFEPDESK